VAHRAELTPMPPFRIFDPYAFLRDEDRAAAPAKPSGAVAYEDEALAALATLAGVQADTSISAPDPILVSLQTDPIDIIYLSSSSAASRGDELRTPTAAKVAKAAKVAETDAEPLAVDLKAPQSSPSTDGAQPTVISPATWYEHLVAPEHIGAPFDKACPERRGRVERVGSVYMHFCVICGAWGSFGYGVTGDRAGLWYCDKHRLNRDQHPVSGEVAADEPR
jgi:hypothetical protein